MRALTVFVAARLAELGPAGPPGGTAAPEGWRDLLEDYEDAVHLTERWAELELAVRLLATRFAEHPDFDPRWRAPAPAVVPVRSGAGRGHRPPAQGRPPSSGTPAQAASVSPPRTSDDPHAAPAGRPAR